MKMLLLCVALVTAGSSYADEKKLNTKYDNFDIDTVISNKRLLKSYTLCFIDQGRCSPEAKEFKEIIPETVKSDCGNCSPKQKEIIRKAIKSIRETYPDHLEQLMDIYDPDKKRRVEFQKFLDSE